MTNINRILCSILLVFSSFTLAFAQVNRSAAFKNKYQLKEVVVLSRHNIRSPLSDGKSLLGQLTPHQWITWSSAPSELSLRGGMLETAMGQFFRKWLVDAGMFTENHYPTADEVSIYANSMQRTIATAQYFASGFMPVANLTVNHRFSPSKMDPVFSPVLTNIDDRFVKRSLKETAQMIGQNHITQSTLNLEESYQLLMKVLDWEKSPLYQSGKHLDFEDSNKMILENGKEPALEGTLKTATSASDALILQYYESDDETQAAFHHPLSMQEWEKIAQIKDVYTDLLFTTPTVACNVAHPLLVYILDELNSEQRKFTFLCGHDSNIASINAALGIKNYSLPEAIEKKTPIGCKLVFEKWSDRTGAEFISINMVYQSVQQLRRIELLNLTNPPMIYPLQIRDLDTNADGLYPFTAIQERFKEAIRAYFYN